MSDEMRVVIENGDDVIRALVAAGLAPSAVLKSAVEAAAVVVEEAAEARAPGSRDIGKRFVGKTQHEASYKVGPTKSKWYYRFFETGRGAYSAAPTKKQALYAGGERPFASTNIPAMAARPFLRPAIDENEQEAALAAGVVWKKALELEANG